MPPKRKIKSKRAKRSPQQTQSSVSSRELTEITRLLKGLNQPQNNVTDLGRMLLKGGNLASSMFGFPKIFGSGSYAMQNSCWSASQQVPIMHSSNESVRIRHREYISDVSVNGAAFTSQVYAINPGLATSFPYLSAVAQNFQEYSFKGLVFEFKTTSATALVSGTNTAMGNVMLAAQYRADAPAFVSKTQLLNEMWSVDTVPSSSCVLPVECNPPETVLPLQYVRTGSVTGDIKLFDLCSLTVATAGAQSGQTNVVGELWVSYDVELRKPQIASVGGGSGSVASYAVAATWTGGNIFSGIAVSVPQTLALTFSGNTVTFPQGAGGYYYIAISSFASLTYGAVSVAYVNCHAAANNIFTSGGFNEASGSGAAYGIVILVTAPSNQQATVTYANAMIPTGSGILSVTATSLPNLPALWGL